MTKRVHATGNAQIHARFNVTGGCDTDKNIIVAAIYHAETGDLEAREFHQHRADALRAADWFKSQNTELVIIESTANYHLLYYDILRASGVNIAVINPIVVKSLLRVEGKSDKGDAMTLAKLAASFDLKTSNMPDSEQRELRLLFKQIDAWKVQRTQIVNRTNGLLTGCGFTVFRLVHINSPAGFKIIQGILDGLSPAQIASFHRNRAKRPEIEKCAAVELPGYMRVYLKVVLTDINSLNRRIQEGEAAILGKSETFELTDQISLMCTVPGITKMLALRIIAEMGENYYQRYYSAEAFAKAIGIVPSNEVSGGKLLKRRASHGNKRLKFHLLFAAKAFAIHGSGPLRAWFDAYRSRSNYMKATSALSRRIAEAVWWVMVRNQPYQFWKGEAAQEGSEVTQVGKLFVNPETGEIIDTTDDDLTQKSD